MKVEKTPNGCMVWLMPEEQERNDVIEAIRKLKETDKVVVFVSGCEDVVQVIHKLIHKSTMKI